MLQHQHIILTLIFLLPFIDFKNQLEAIISISIILIFSVLPDIDITGKKFLNSGIKLKGALRDYFSLLSYLTELTRIIVYIPYDFIIRIILRKKSSYHRESSHSIIFLIATLLVFGLLIYLLSLALNIKISVASNYIVLATLAFIIHLFLDSVTVNGIKWFYPLNIIEIKGRLNTSNTRDVLIVDLYIAFISIMILIYYLSTFDPLSTFIPQFLKELSYFWSYLYPSHTYLLAIPLILFLREVKISL